MGLSYDVTRLLDPTNEGNLCKKKLTNLPEDQAAPSATGIKLAGELDQLSKTIPPLNLKTVLVPTDFSENSKKALIYAVRLAQRNDSSLILFHAFELPEFVRQRPPSQTPSSIETAKAYSRPERRT